MPTFGDVVERSLALLERRGRVSRTALRLEFDLDDATLAALIEELVEVLGAADDDGRVLAARNGAVAAIPATAKPPDAHAAEPPAEPDQHRPPAAPEPPDTRPAQDDAIEESGRKAGTEELSRTSLDAPQARDRTDDPGEAGDDRAASAPTEEAQATNDLIAAAEEHEAADRRCVTTADDAPDAVDDATEEPTEPPAAEEPAEPQATAEPGAAAARDKSHTTGAIFDPVATGAPHAARSPGTGATDAPYEPDSPTNAAAIQTPAEPESPNPAATGEPAEPRSAIYSRATDAPGDPRATTALGDPHATTALDEPSARRTRPDPAPAPSTPALTHPATPPAPRAPEPPAATPPPPANPVTVVLCDLVETPELAALDADARGAVAARVQSICREAAERQHGHVQPWISDGVAIVFGHDRPLKDDAARAVRCGWEIVRTLDAVRGAIASEHDVRANVRVGVATTATTAIGDATLAAGRVQDDAEPDRVTVDAATRARADARFSFEPRTDGRSVVVRATTPPTAGAPTPLVGRSAELALLRALAERAAAGTRAAALLRGAAGIGKTRLIEELAASAGAELGMSVLACAASPSHRGSALYPILSGLRAAWELDDGPDAPARLAARAAGLPGGDRAIALLATTLAVPNPDGIAELPALSPRRRRRETLHVLAHALAAESRRAPLLLIVEDLHWADPSTLELLSMVLEGPRDVALMLALTARGEFLPPASAALQRIDLAQLDAHECRAIVEFVAARSELPDGLAGNLAARAAGSPLLAEQLARTVVLSGQAEPDAAATLYGCLMARLDRDSTARSVARLAATIGREIDVATIAATGAAEPAVLDWGLERLVEEHVVVATTPGRYAFTHTLLQEAARSSLDMETLREHNSRIAGTLLERFPRTAASEPERVARHLEYAGELAESVRHWQRAGQRALDGHALREATGHFERGIELITRTADGPERRARELELRVLAGLSIAARRGWGAPTSAAHFARADALSHSVEPSRHLFAALQRLAAYRATSGRVEDACTLARAQLATAEHASEPELLVEAECQLGLTLGHLGRHREALAHLARAAELFDPGRDGAHAERFGRHPAAIALAHQGLALACRGDRDGARAAVARAARLLRAQPHPLSRAWLQCTAATAALVCGERAVALRESSVALRVSSDEGLDDWHAHASVLHGWARVLGGDHVGGIAQLRAGVEAWARSGALLLRPFQHGLLADALGRSGEPELGLRALDEALSLSTYGEAWCEPELHRIRAELLSTVGDVLGARRSAQAAVALARRATAGGWEQRAAATLAALAGGSVAA